MKKQLRNIKLLIGYDGTDFSGWQRQRHARTIQGEIEGSLQRMTNEDILLNGAGRTDAGVHAEGMVAHFLTASTITCDNFLRGLNAMLCGAIRIYSAEEVAASFHARFSAIGKDYQYEISPGKFSPPGYASIPCMSALPSIARQCGNALSNWKEPTIFHRLKTAAPETRRCVRGGGRFEPSIRHGFWTMGRNRCPCM